ncbi:hypothetical protein J6590_087507 [Homalodisca vitripennis]|nr:hypothetical protein J6590_087507 [Homalodisca vitripennis]
MGDGLRRLNGSICATTSFLVRKLHTALLHWQTYFGCVCATLSGWCNVFGRKIGDKINNNKSCSRDGRSGTDSSGGNDNDKITVGVRELSRRVRKTHHCCICLGEICCESRPTLLLPCFHNSVVHTSCAWDWVCCNPFTDPVAGLYHISCPMCRSTRQTRLVSYRELTRNLHATRPRRMGDSVGDVTPVGGEICGGPDSGSGSEETEADYRARLLHMDTLLRLNDSINSFQEIRKNKPEYAAEVQKALRSSLGGCDLSQPPPSQDCDTVELEMHAHLIYHGDLLQLSKETVHLVVRKHEMELFTRIVDCFKRMILGTHTDEDVADMRNDNDSLIRIWDKAQKRMPDIGGELNNMMRVMLDTPLYYGNSCMAMIACGQMLRNLYVVTEGIPCKTYDQLIAFVRKHFRHNPADPFACDCDGRCSETCKTLMSMIMELPAIVHNQTYLLQILAYVLYDKSGREEIFVNNLKNTCSPGLLDRIPTRVAMLMGTLDEAEIIRRYRVIRKKTRHLNPMRGRTTYGAKTVLEGLVRLAHDPRIRTVVELLPGADVAAVQLRLPKCAAEKTQCLNRDFDENSILEPESNNGGKNKCCGFLRKDPSDFLVSSVSLAQLLVYLYTDPRTASNKSRKHYFIRDIITNMAGQTLKIKVDTLEEMYCYLDRTRVFKDFNEHPFMMSALQELFTTYIDYMKDAAEKYKETRKSRRRKSYLHKKGIVVTNRI